VEARLAPVKALGDGILFRKPESYNDILVYKSEGVVYLYFHADLDAEIQSRMELEAPLHLLSPYSRLVMLGLLWNPAPKRIYVIGFGGGRIPMVMHHVLPETVIDCADIDRDVVDVAMRFFGVAKDARLKISIQDGRRKLAEHPAAEPYDMIVVDAFIGVGSGPRDFSTCEFFALCREKLTPEGVTVINLLDNDTQHALKKRTIIESFPQVFSVRDEERGNQVLFGCNSAALGREALLARVEGLEALLGLSFALKPLAQAMKLQPPPPVGASASIRGELLHDAKTLSFAEMASVRLGRNDPCFCGSGKKYKKCHG
jgi:spermidine synthase